MQPWYFSIIKKKSSSSHPVSPAYLESQCSYNSPAAVLMPPPPPPPHGGNKADSALQLLIWPEWDTRCSWSDQAPHTPDRSCRSLHKRGLSPDDGQEKGLILKRPRSQTHSHSMNFKSQPLILSF